MKEPQNQPINSLIFIPDISGYTNFLHETEIEHAKHIVEELLEAILSANEINLELSEIEGDALLMYRKGKAPTCQELLGQIQKMYINFHAHLKKYETQRICNCGACCTAGDLELKFVTHYGELTETVINHRRGLFGPSVIAAHRLLKNKVNSDRYSLFSNELMAASPTWSDLPDLAWGEITQLEEEYDFGTAGYSFVSLENLLELVPEPSIEDYSIPGATKKLFETSDVIEAPIDLVFNVISDYHFRSKFIEGQLDNDMQNHEIFQNGSVHRCILGKKNEDTVFVTHDHAFDKNRITFVETDKNNGISLVWTLRAISKEESKIGMASFMEPNFLKVGLFNLFIKKKVTSRMKKSWKTLNEYCKKLVAENRSHPNSIVLPDLVTKGVS